MRFSWSLTWMSLALLTWTTGCEKPAAPQAKGGDSAKAATVAAKPSAEDEHDHPTHGPHEGDLIELGDEEYHAEFVHDEKTFDVTVYILDSSAKKAVPIAATEVVINIKPKDGKPEQHKLAAQPQEGDGEGKSSRFVSPKNKSVCDSIEAEAEARLQVTINGKAFSGEIVHDHEDHGHDDEHHDDSSKK